MATQIEKKLVFSSAVELAAALEGKEFAETVQKQLDDTQLVNALQALRITKGLSQAEVAHFIGCSPSRISRIENSRDSELRLGDLQEYARALGCELHVLLSLSSPQKAGGKKGKSKLLPARR